MELRRKAPMAPPTALATMTSKDDVVLMFSVLYWGLPRWPHPNRGTAMCWCRSPRISAPLFPSLASARAKPRSATSSRTRTRLPPALMTQISNIPCSVRDDQVINAERHAFPPGLRARRFCVVSYTDSRLEVMVNRCSLATSSASVEHGHLLWAPRRPLRVAESGGPPIAPDFRSALHRPPRATQ